MLQEIIDKLTKHEEYNHLVYVGKDYNKAQLVYDLRKLLKQLEK